MYSWFNIVISFNLSNNFLSIVCLNILFALTGLAPTHVLPVFISFSSTKTFSIVYLEHLLVFPSQSIGFTLTLAFEHINPDKPRNLAKVVTVE